MNSTVQMTLIICITLVVLTAISVFGGKGKDK